MSEIALGFVAAENPEATLAYADLTQRYEHVGPDRADVIVALGGDGFMIETLHRFMSRNVPIYGMNRGTVGFLMNLYHEDDLPERIAAADRTPLHPLRMHATCNRRTHRRRIGDQRSIAIAGNPLRREPQDRHRWQRAPRYAGL